ncbi:hypothetical protein COV11_04585 [Candidatus Woesearchaeota archaeon CG10_big_fil_rev_8_21_14_0_10_30_7]|nr:MAG: hypothetical protein COV11_04585 [Candidatus Woesearchaeota archaeon CG10_big_fil_rev_8_21_14_0_10_30_7]
MISDQTIQDIAKVMYLWGRPDRFDTTRMGFLLGKKGADEIIGVYIPKQEEHVSHPVISAEEKQKAFDFAEKIRCEIVGFAQYNGSTDPISTVFTYQMIEELEEKLGFQPACLITNMHNDYDLLEN